MASNQPIRQLSERLEAAIASGDPGRLLGADVLTLAGELAQALAQDAAGVPPGDLLGALDVLTTVHWLRYQLLPEGQDQDDIRACLYWSAALLPVAPDLVPEPVRAHLTGRGSGAGRSDAEASARGTALYREYRRTGNSQLLQAAITLFRDSVDATQAGDPTRTGRLSNLGNALRSRFERTGRQADLEEAITILRGAAESAPADDRGRPTGLYNLGTAVLTRFERAGRQADLEEAITLFRDAAKSVLPDDPNRPSMLSLLGSALVTRFGYTGQQADLDQAITFCRQAVSSAAADHPDRPAYLSNLGGALYARFGRTRQRADLEEAVGLFRGAADVTQAGHPAAPGRMHNLGNALLTRFERTGQQADLEESITLLRDAVSAAPAGDPLRPSMLSHLGNALRARFDLTGQAADWEEGLALLRDAVDATPAGNPALPGMLFTLGGALQTRFGSTRHQADLEGAITFLRRALDATPADHADRPRHAFVLGNALKVRFGLIGEQADLEEAITLLRDSVAAAPADDAARPGVVSVLGYALRARFELTGQEADLEEAITLLRGAVDAAPADAPARPGMLEDLGSALQARFRRTGQQADLEEAITLHRHAVDDRPADNIDGPGYLSSLGNALQTRFLRTGQQADLEEAITVLRASVAAWGDRTASPVLLSNLGAALLRRSGRSAQEADLEEAITLFRGAIGATPAGHPFRAAVLSNLARALHNRFERTGQQADLDQAITVCREAVGSAAPDHPDRPAYLSNLGSALRARFGRTGQQTDLDQAVTAFREGAGILTASPSQRVAAAQQWGLCALQATDPESAVQGFTAAIELLPLVAWHGLDQATREHHLREWAGLASDAAVAAVTTGDAARAVELLEAGRSMLWAQAAHLRQDLAALQDRAPGLAAALEASRAVLNRPFTGAPGAPDIPDEVGRGQAAEQRMLEERRRAAREWDAAVKQIRQIEGYKYFLRPVPFADLRAAAVDGPVVIVNIGRHGSHALIITPAAGPDPEPAVLVVGLPAAPMRTVVSRTTSLLGALDRAGDPGPDWQEKEADRHAVFNILAWCWEAITEPVLAALGRTCTPGEKIEDWPRVWWSPTGPATVLPLHAAGRHPRTAAQHQAMGETAAVADSVAGRVVSSYIPTLTALIRARARPAPTQVRQLAVGVPEPPAYAHGASPLPAVPDELEVLAGYLPPPEQATHLAGTAATWQAVEEALPGHSWLHLSCHGVQHPADAALSAFFLHDRPLTLADLAPLNLHQTDLAYLAACETSAGDLRLLDEALHLAGALQLAGYCHVLATLWTISDDAAPLMADIIYAHLLHPDPDHPHPADSPESARAPYALHHAVTRLRQAAPGEPLLWAPYIHLGP